MLTEVAEGDAAVGGRRGQCAGGFGDENLPTVTRGGKNGKFMFVDTVLSGRAICEIVQGFDAYQPVEKVLDGHGMLGHSNP